MANGSSSACCGHLHVPHSVLCAIVLVNIICIKRLFVVFEGFRSGPAARCLGYDIVQLCTTISVIRMKSSRKIVCLLYIFLSVSARSSSLHVA